MPADILRSRCLQLALGGRSGRAVVLQSRRWPGSTREVSEQGIHHGHARDVLCGAANVGGPVSPEEHPPLGQRQAAEGAMDWVTHLGPSGEAGRCDIRLSCRLAPMERRSEDLSGEGSYCPPVRHLSWDTTAYHPEAEWSTQSVGPMGARALRAFLFRRHKTKNCGPLAGARVRSAVGSHATADKLLLVCLSILPRVAGRPCSRPPVRLQLYRTLDMSSQPSTLVLYSPDSSRLNVYPSSSHDKCTANSR